MFSSRRLSQTDDAVAIMLQERAIAEKIDRQLTHRSAARSISALGLMLAHEIKNPLSGIRGAAQLLEAGASDEDRALTRLICEETDRIVKARRPDAIVRRFHAVPMGKPQYSRRVGPREAFGSGRVRAPHSLCRGLRPLAAGVLGSRDQLIQVFLNLAKNAAEAIGNDSVDGEITLTTAYRPGVRLRTTPNAEPVALAARDLRSRQRPGHCAGDSRQSVRSLRDDESPGLWSGSCTGGQADWRPWRHYRVRVASAQDDVSRADAVALAARGGEMIGRASGRRS